MGFWNLTTPAHDECGEGFPLTHEPHRTLPHGFPLPQITRANWRDYEHIGPDGWMGYGPPEDSATPPDVTWTEAQRMLVLASYQQEWGRFLEPNQTYETTWPPEGSLWAAGAVHRTLKCSDHDDPDCEDCAEFVDTDGEIVPAEWHWTVTIETYEWEGTRGSLEERERFHFLTTRMDPREVDYQW